METENTELHKNNMYLTLKSKMIPFAVGKSLFLFLQAISTLGIILKNDEQMIVKITYDVKRIQRKCVKIMQNLEIYHFTAI